MKALKLIAYLQQLVAMVALNSQGSKLLTDFSWELRPLVTRLDYASKRLLLHTCASHHFRMHLTEAILQASRDFGTQLVGTDAKPAAASGAQLTQDALDDYYLWLIPAIDTDTEDDDDGSSSGGGGGKQRAAASGGGGSGAKSKVEAGADAEAAVLKRLNKRDPRGETKLHKKAKQGKLDDVRELLKQKATPNTQCNAGLSPLMETCTGGHAAVVKLLLKHGADPNVVAAEMSDSTTALLEVINYVEDHMEDDAGDKPATESAIVQQGIALIQLLLDAGADPAIGGMRKEDLPVCRAARVHPELRLTLVAHTEKINAAKAEKATAAAGNGSSAGTPAGGSAAAAGGAGAGPPREAPAEDVYRKALSGYTVNAAKAQEYLLVVGCLLESAAALGTVPPPSKQHVEALQKHIAAMSKGGTASPRCVALLKNMAAISSC